MPWATSPSSSNSGTTLESIQPFSSFLTRLGFPYVCVDRPRLKGLLPPVGEATSTWPHSFHGRNAASWWNHKEAYERYDYLYTKGNLPNGCQRSWSLPDERRKSSLV